MRKKNFILILMVIATLPATAQIFNFSLRTNNQQLIDEAMTGAFVRINQCYALCDTIKNERFGREGKDYFSIIPFVGIETENGLIFPTVALSPWESDEDFKKYKGLYKPIITKTILNILNGQNDKRVQDIQSPFAGLNISKYFSVHSNLAQENCGLKVDTVPGVKKGWMVWLSSDSNLSESDTIKYTSFSKEIEVPKDGSCLSIDKPEISEQICGGVYITPVQSSIGQLTFTLTGIMVLSENGWLIDFPYVKEPIDNNSLTPIKITDVAELNPLKKKQK